MGRQVFYLFRLQKLYDGKERLFLRDRNETACINREEISIFRLKRGYIFLQKGPFKAGQNRKKDFIPVDSACLIDFPKG